MSSVRMCDNPNCGEIFSEAEIGWTVSSQTKVTETEDGSTKLVSFNVDLCPECSPDTKAAARGLSERRKAKRLLELEAATGDPIQRELDAEEKRNANGS